MSCVCPKIPNSMYFMVLGRKLKDLGIDAAPLSSSFNLDSGRKWHPENEELTLKGGQRWEFDLLCLTKETESLKIRIFSNLHSERAKERVEARKASPRAGQGGMEEYVTPSVKACHWLRDQRLRRGIREWKVRKHYRIQQLEHRFFKRSTSAKCKD